MKTDFEADYTIHVKGDPLLPSSLKKVPRLLAERRRLAGMTHFLESRRIRREIISMLAKFAEEATAHGEHTTRSRALETIS